MPLIPSASPKVTSYAPLTASSSYIYNGPMNLVKYTVSFEKVDTGLTSTFKTYTLNSEANTIFFVVSIANVSFWLD